MATMKNRVSNLSDCKVKVEEILGKLNSSLFDNDEKTVDLLYNELKKLAAILEENVSSIQENASAIDNNEVW